MTFAQVKSNTFASNMFNNFSNVRVDTATATATANSAHNVLSNKLNEISESNFANGKLVSSCQTFSSLSASSSFSASSSSSVCSTSTLHTTKEKPNCDRILFKVNEMRNLEANSAEQLVVLANSSISSSTSSSSSSSSSSSTCSHLNDPTIHDPCYNNNNINNNININDNNNKQIPTNRIYCFENANYGHCEFQEPRESQMTIDDPTKTSINNNKKNKNIKLPFTKECHVKSNDLNFVREMYNFDGLEMAGLALRKALNDMKQSDEQRKDKRAYNANSINVNADDDALHENTIHGKINNERERDFVCLTYSSAETTTTTTNDVRFAPVDCCTLMQSYSSTSSDHLNLVESNRDNETSYSNQFCLAFDNLTYFSSIESDLPLHTTKHEQLDLALVSSENESDQDDNDEFNMEVKQAIVNALANPSESALKKTLKSIKRKDKLKKSSGCTFGSSSNVQNEVLTDDDDNDNDNDDDEEMLFDKNKISFRLTIVNKPLSSSVLTKTKSMPDLTQLQNDEKPLRLAEPRVQQEKAQDDVMISNSEYEKQLKKLLRNKSFSRSLRRAKTVYYRNRRSKSIEDLSIEERNTYLARINSNLNFNLLKHKRNSTQSASSVHSSCSSSGTSNGLASDISSSYFHELSDWSPEFNTSNSESSQEELFHNVDWDAKFSSIVFVSPLFHFSFQIAFFVVYFFFLF
jgi:hypothetical protein